MKATIIYFSPTGTTKKYAENIAKGLNINTTFIDITNVETREHPLALSGDVIIWGFPVYGARIPKIVLEYFQTMRGSQTPLAVFAVYGNISAGFALNEAVYLAENQNFRLLGTATFIGEHSFSGKDIDVALGRPCADDLQDAERFGQLIYRQLESDNFKLFRRKAKHFPLLIEKFPYSGIHLLIKQPDVDIQKCIHCKSCVVLCPVNAISSETLKIDSKLCLRCCACVKICPTMARQRIFRISLIGKILKKLGAKRQNSKVIIYRETVRHYLPAKSLFSAT
ncbi:MAG: EFR1 family ferrodoxin [Oscillospiraceae bacterium]|nr:EFR1 family ferrodoxin [Oscillospiraceae bacterium]